MKEEELKVDTFLYLRDFRGVPVWHLEILWGYQSSYSNFF